MGRKRRRTNSHLPKYVYPKRGWYIFRPYQGRVNGRSVYGSDIQLCKESAPLSEMHTAYERATGKDSTGTLKWLLEKYHASKRFESLAAKTRKEYLGYRGRITSYPTYNGRLFGDFELKKITKKSAATYRDKYKGSSGKLAPVAANRHLQYLKSAWNTMAESLDNLPQNPFEKVRLNEEIPRDRYVTTEEYDAAFSLATGYIPIFLELAFLLRARRSEVATLKKVDILPDGVRLDRLKGSEGEITYRTPRLNQAIKLAEAFNADAPTPIAGAYLIHDKKGQPIKKNAFDSAWRRFMNKVEAAGIERFTLHDLKAKGITEQKDNFGGHRDRSGKMRRTYVRALQVVEPPE